MLKIKLGGRTTLLIFNTVTFINDLKYIKKRRIEVNEHYMKRKKHK